MGVLGRDRPWQRGRRRPSGHGRHGGDEFAGDVAAVLTVAQERSHGGDDAFEAWRPQMGHLAANEFDDVDGDDSTHVDLARAEVVLEELPRHARVALDRR
ncbi:hypothetical protein [Variovorax guangxiensis]|uniref:hypothetical protein n=1 Tax=Variovorax guangxiensis TaxID=1775474 RepID=UPI00286B3138|nr:hypothetical protein [Variovorax guangxiensis]